MNVEQRIQKRIDDLVQEALLIAREEAVRSISSALGARGRKQERTGPAVSRAKYRGRRRALAKKRAPDEIAALSEQLYEAICEKPGETMTLYSRVVESTPRELNVPVKRLIEGGRVRPVGERSQRRYFLSAGTE